MGAQAPAAAGRLRLLTRVQFENSLRDLLGDVPVGTTEPDTVDDGFASIGASHTAISPHGVEQVAAAVLGALEHAFADPARRDSLVGCVPVGPGDQACLRSFLTGFGRRAWRRPLTGAEIDRFVALARQAAQGLGDVHAGLMHTASAILTSPNFLYRVELGLPAEPGPYRYTDWELATRLSYFLWNTTPDSQLLAAAAAGRLTTGAGIRAEVARLLASPRARAGFADGFGREWFGLDALATAPKNDARMTTSLRAAMAAELRRHLETRLEPEARLLDLVDTRTAHVNAELAAIYGIPGITGTELVAASLPAAVPRAGLLGTAAFLTMHSKQDVTSPTARGKFVREAVLCTEVPDPPDNLDTTFQEPPPGSRPTLREHMEMHRTSPACAACHQLTDPIGYAFEAFDWVGAHRQRDNGKPVDTTGDLDGVPFANALELARALRSRPDTVDCLLRSMFRYVQGHKETAADAAELAAWKRAFEASGGRMVAFVTEIAASEGFRTVSPVH